LSSWAKRRI